MRATLFAALCLTLAACGDETGNATDAGAADAIPAAQRYLPLATGATWTWHVVHDDGDPPPYDKVSTVEAFEKVGDIMAYRVRTDGNDGDTVSWQEDTGSAIRRVREQSFDPTGTLLSDQSYTPYKLRLDEQNDHLVVGATYTESYTEIETDAQGGTTSVAKTEVWTVEAIDESVTVPAGTFACLRVHRIGTDPGEADKVYWFARGIGKIKESGKQTEELTSYSGGAP
jgi:hypothetical protein